MASLLNTDSSVRRPDSHNKSSSKNTLSLSSLTDVTITTLPPPYSPLSGTSHGRSEFDNLLYKKMLSLESMVSDIHGSVIDQSASYQDISIQLKDMKDSLKLFQEEASVRIRNRLAEKLSTLDSPTSSQEILDSSDEDSQEPENDEATRYDRVCSMLETLIKDASSVLVTPESNHTVVVSDQTSLKPLLQDLESDYESGSPDSLSSSKEVYFDAPSTEDFSLDDVDIKFFCQVSQGDTLIKRHELSRRMILPFLKDGVDVDRLALLSGPSLNRIESNQEVTLRPDQTTELQRLVLDNSSQTFVALFYWVLVFTVGSILFDSSLCNTAGLQVLRILNTLSKKPRHSRKRSITITIPNPSIPVIPSLSSPVPTSNSLRQRRKSI